MKIYNKGRWYNNIKLIHFPQLNLSKYEDFTNTWTNCINLVDFPIINISNGKAFNHAWEQCSSLTHFPKLNMSNGEIFRSTWQNCSSMLSFPAIDFINGGNFASTWYNCSELSEFPFINVSNGYNFERCWAYCHKLKYFPPNMFDNLHNEIWFYCFQGTWEACDLNSQSVENIILSINRVNADVRLASRTITIGMNRKEHITEKTMNAIKELKSKHWNTFINNKKI